MLSEPFCWSALTPEKSLLRCFRLLGFLQKSLVGFPRFPPGSSGNWRGELFALLSHQIFSLKGPTQNRLLIINYHEWKQQVHSFVGELTF